MTGNKRTSSVKHRGRLFLLAEVIAIGLILYLTYSHKPYVTLELHTTLQYYGARLTEFDHAESKQPKFGSGSNNQSRWIRLFPHLEHLVRVMENIPELPFSAVTSARHTTVSIVEESSYRVGGRLSAVIHARDNRNVAKSYGGDFFVVTLRRQEYANDGVSCEVKDHMNGSYDVICILPWSGTALLRVMLVHPSEGIYHMIKTYSSVTEYGVVLNTTILNSFEQKEYTNCTIGYPEISPEQLCNYSNPRHGEPWFCVRPASGECGKIIWQQKVEDAQLMRYFDDVYFRKSVNHNVQIKGSGAEVIVSGSSNDASQYITKNRYTVALDPSHPSGWFLNDQWTSTKIKSSAYSASHMQACARNKEIYFIGDSTIRQWFYHFVKYFGVRDYGLDNSVVWSNSRDGVRIDHNLTLHYRSHGPPLHNPGPPVARPYITNSIDSIKTGGKGTFVFITLGLHYEMYDPDVFGSRLRKIRQSVESLLSRLPGIEVYIKGLHTHDHASLCPSAWMSYRYDVMLRHEFQNVRGVTYFDMWDFTVLLRNQRLHPVSGILTKQIGLFLSYIC